MTKNRKARYDIKVQQSKYFLITTPTLQWLRSEQLRFIRVLEGALRYQAWVVLMAVTREILFRNHILKNEIAIMKVWEL